MLVPVECITKAQRNDLGGGVYSVTYPAGSATFLSIQPNGTIETRPSVGGDYERFRLNANGSGLVCVPDATHPTAFEIPYCGI